MFINEDFMLSGETAKRLYHGYAEGLPIIDFHCHLSPKMIAENYKFSDAADLFLSGDHYKWRLMRTDGTDERYITGDAEPFEKFRAFAACVPHMIGNPMYHWTHLELKRYFGIDEPLNERNAERVWDICNSHLEKEEYRARGLIGMSNVRVICTTDDPMSSLEYHEWLKDFSAMVLPTFRPDAALGIDKDGFCEYINAADIKSYDELLNRLSERVEYFAEHGCRLSDHSVEKPFFVEDNAAAVFERKMNGAEISERDAEIYRTEVLKQLAAEYSAHGWAMQLHIGAMRNINRKMFLKLGADSGFDAIGDTAFAEKLAQLLDCLNTGNSLPKTVLYNLNPKDNYTIAAMLGSFQGAPVSGKLQFGSGWWFNDNRDGMENQLKCLANLGLLSGFVGMLTDSRSFVSYTRHEYFRRILCNLIGGWVDGGEYPDDEDALRQIIRGICFENAEKYFNFGGTL